MRKDPGLVLWARLLAEAGRLGPGKTLLDVGGGAGVLAAAVSEAGGARALVADPEARADMLPAVRARADALPFPDDAFHAVLFSHVLHHLPDPLAAIHEAARVLAPGGRLLIRTATPEDLLRIPHARWIPDMMASILATIAPTVPTVPGIRAWLEEVGLATLETRSVKTPGSKPLARYADEVADAAWREWAFSASSGPDPRGAARAWVLETFRETPPVPETLLVAEKPHPPACPKGLQ